MHPTCYPKPKWKVAAHYTLEQYDHAITKRSVNRGHPTIHPQLHKFGGGLPSTISTAAAYFSLKNILEYCP